ncbi:isocitrate lyase/phosphoenolpyruvate mutase family protein [Pseudoalteromonas sp. XMcav1-K]|uniref:isocitrate lyase/PEP mutase family protein n=1 Tax=Pseudoalteromonas sp. XMcav1-K TaxID=3374372 RepID=UPI003756EF3C
MTYTHFNQLHFGQTAVLIANVWDVPSALAAKHAGFNAIGTSSAAVAAQFGYEDGESMPFETLLMVVERILVNTDLPLTVDLESGYSDDPEVVATNIMRLVNLGVVGINIEDSKVNNGTRVLKNADEFASFLSHIQQVLKQHNCDVFINVRTDTYILECDDKLQETIKRGQLYQAVGATGLFVPCITDLNEISKVRECVSLPLNVMCMPDLADFDTLAKLGVNRVSMGNFVFEKHQTNLSTLLSTINKQKRFTALFD